MTLTERRSPVGEGMAVYAGAVGADGVPAGCRAVALTSRDELSTVTVYVPMATSRDLLAGVAATKRLAIVATYPPTHSTMQLKGIATGVRLAEDGERELIASRLEAFAQVLNLLGYPLRVTRSINHWPAFAIDMKVEEIFEQTPGPKAGTLIR